MSSIADRPHLQERRPLKLTLFGLNLLALLALIVPTFLILESVGATVGFEPDVLIAVVILFAAGVLACAAAMTLMTGKRTRAGAQALALLLPLAAFSLMGAFAILAVFTF